MRLYVYFPGSGDSRGHMNMQSYAQIGVCFLQLFLVDQPGQSVALFVCGAYHGSRGSGRTYHRFSSAFRNYARSCGGGQRVHPRRWT